jgi:hypothetical protein
LEKNMKKLVIVAEMPDNAAAALEYGPGIMENWAEDALANAWDCDVGDTEWGADVQRLFGVKPESGSHSFNVVEARIEDAPGPEKVPIDVELDEDTERRLVQLAKARGVSLGRMCEELVMEEARRKLKATD